MYKVSLIIPVYNEEKQVVQVLKNISSCSYEVIVVDDGSEDKTSEIVNTFNNVKLVKHEKNYGKGKALLTGVGNSKGNILVFMDGDNQFDINEVKKVVSPLLEKKADFVIGRRDLSDIPLIRRFSNFLSSFSIKFFFGKQVSDPLSGFKAFSRAGFHRLDVTKDRYEVEFDMVFEAIKKGLRIEEVPVSVRYGDEKSSIKISDNIKSILFVIKEGVRYRLSRS